MHFTIQKTLFASALSRAAAIAGTRSTMPILACVKLVVDDFGCRVIATDLEISFETYIEHTGDAELDGLQTLTLCLPAKLLADVVKAVPVTFKAHQRRFLPPVCGDWLAPFAAKIQGGSDNELYDD